MRAQPTELPQGAVDRDAYVVCVLEQLFRALKRRDIPVAGALGVPQGLNECVVSGPVQLAGHRFKADIGHRLPPINVLKY